MKVDPRAESSRDVKDAKVQDVKVQDAKDVQTVKASDLRSAQKPNETPPDAVKLSDALKLADEAVRAAAISGDVRPEAVARARQLMATGQLGADLDALADHIIDSLLESRESPK